MKKVLILGCSHAAGTEMWLDPMTPKSVDWIRFGLDHSFAAMIAKKLDYDFTNMAFAGGSNDAMFRIWESSHATLNTGDLVIACWTGCNRTEVWNEIKQEWTRLIAGDDLGNEHTKEIHKQWTLWFADDRLGYLNKLKNIMALNSMAHALGIRVINIDSFWPIAYHWPSHVFWPEVSNFMSWCSEQKHPSTPWGHYFLEAHEQFAELVISSPSLKRYLST